MCKMEERFQNFSDFEVSSLFVISKMQFLKNKQKWILIWVWDLWNPSKVIGDMGGKQLLPEGEESKTLTCGGNDSQPRGSAKWPRTGGH